VAMTGRYDDLMITIHPGQPDEVVVPFMQAARVGALISEHGPDTHWHFNDCGCCICVHPDGDKGKAYIVTSDGEAHYYDHPPEAA
jgi:hypothetical protein